MSLSVIASPDAESDLVVILSVLEANGIPYFVHSAHASGLFPGLQIASVNARRVMVPTECAAEAMEALSTLRSVPVEAKPSGSFGATDALRVIVEFFFMGLCVPRLGSRYNADDDDPGAQQ